ncbi:hypothetical protein AB6M97_08775 [Streptococcus hillyeri]|uniref:hypothetical protein n=1 Tax=Streptococcus hillyeri TaxID=2282420 RepID=UPI0034E20A3F
MKVKELAKVFNEYTPLNVVSNGKYLVGDFPNQFLNCELEVVAVDISVDNTLIIYAK